MIKNIIQPITLLILIFIIVSTAGGEMRPVLKKRAGTPPFEVLAEIIRTSEHRFAEETTKESTNTVEPTPHLIWITDLDPNLQPATVYGNPGNKVLILRSLGSRLENVEPELDHAILNLRSPVLLISSNTGDPVSGRPDDKEASAKVLTVAEDTVDQQISLAVERYKKRLENGRLTVIGSIIDSADLYGRGRGRLVVINVNGETDSSAIRSLPVTTRIAPFNLATNFGRNPP